MSCKSFKFAGAAAAIAVAFNLASAEMSSALAQAIDPQSVIAAPFIADRNTALADEGDAAADTAPVASAINDPQDIQTDQSDQTGTPIFVSREIVQDVPDVPEPVVLPASTLKAYVARRSVPDALSDEMQCLAGAVYFEARGEPLAGQLAVAKVVMNRAEHHRFPSSYCGVVYQRSQFSFVRGGKMPRIKTGSKAWQQAKKIAAIAHAAEWQSEAEDALYFHAKYVKPRWARSKTAKARIKTHIFYR